VGDRLRAAAGRRGWRGRGGEGRRRLVDHDHDHHHDIVIVDRHVVLDHDVDHASGDDDVVELDHVLLVVDLDEQQHVEYHQHVEADVALDRGLTVARRSRRQARATRSSRSSEK
jgi:hypothetical protein